MIKATLRGLFQRKLRLGLAVFAIVLSVAFLAGSMVLTSTLSARFVSLFETINQNVAVQVQPEDADAEPPAFLTPDDLDRLAQLPGAEVVQGEVSSEGVVPFRSSDGEAISTGAPNIGVGIEGDDRLGLLHLDEGNWPATAGEVAVTRHTAEAAEVEIGDQLKVYLPLLQEAREFRVVGIAVYTGDRASLGGETVIGFELTEAQELLYGQAGAFGRAQLGAAPGVSQQVLKDQVAQVLPAGFEAKTGDEVTEAESSEISSVFSTLSNIVFTPFAIVAVLVGIFLIYNTFNIIVAQRARELALLRALGAGWGQVIRSVMLEALVVGLAGATLGLLAGIGLGAAGEAVLSGFMNLQLPSGGLVVTGWAVFWAYLVGVGVTMIAAFIPAIKASLVPPVAAMRETVRPDKSLRGLTIAGLALAVPGGGLVALALTGIGSATIWVLVGGVLLLFFGVALLSPLLSKPVVRAAGAIAGWGQAGKLGVRNALRNPRRTAVTAAALMIGVTLISTAGVVAESAKATITSVLDQDLGAEIIIQANGQPGAAGFSATAVEEIRAVPGVAEAAAWYLDASSPTSFVVATDVPTAQRMFGMDLIDGELRTLTGAELVVDDQVAADRGWTVGERVEVPLTKNPEQTFTVVGIYERTAVMQGIIVGEPAVTEFAGDLAFQGFVQLAEGADADTVVSRVEEIMGDFPMVTVGDLSDFVAQQTAIFDILLAIITVLLGLAIFIALLGILNTLLLSILERTRELGLVRAVGMSRGGLMRMVTVESVLISVFGCVLGIALGIGLGTAFVSTLINEEQLTELALPWGNLLLYLLVAIVAGVIAALWPAWRAARLNVLDAIAYE